ncbi:MAG: M14 family metallopeptidase [Candidatus Neomarinimicrobiota bacterium]|nr:M14 family metallopeptidase [Candidatus Neomarinimicrobiota bacterium]
MLKSLKYIVLINGLLFASELKTPGEFLGYELGDYFTPHYKVVSYYEHVSEEESNVKTIKYGETYERRPLMVAIVSSEKNMSMLEDLRIDNLKRAGILKGKPNNKKIGIVWLSYNVHGNEANSTEAAMKTLYALADKNNRSTQKWLENTIVILDPCINPDGRDRYANWYRMIGNRWPDADPNSREHMEPWPGGRTNHYYFDLNRDWAWQTQKESVARLKLYNLWLPHVHVDFHEQGINNEYYFAPAAEPYHEYISDWQREFQTMIGKNHAKYFDKNNWLYFTKEVFDLLYPSYGDTYPTYSGAIGMTYEQAGHSRGGLAVETEDGDTLTLSDRLTHHHTTGLSTIEVASNNVEKMVDEFEKFFIDNKNEPKGPYKSYVISKSNNVDKLNDLRLWLENNGIDYGLASLTKSYRGLNYKTGKSGQVKVQKGDLVVSAYQSKSVLVQVLFEPKTELRDTLTYDITAWAIPYSYGLDAYAINGLVKSSSSTKINGSQTKKVSKLISGQPYAYILDWKGIKDLKFLAYLFQNDIVSRVSMEPFKIDEKEYDPGTLVITRKGNEKHGSKFDEILQTAATKFDRSLEKASSGFVSRGKDFGSSSMKVVKRPKVGLISGDGVRSYAFGEVWHFFERQIEFPVTVIEGSSFTRIPKHDFDVFILPSGNYYYLDDEMRNELRHWVRSGGRLILMDSAMDKFVDHKGYNLKRFANDDEKKQFEKKRKKRELSERLNSFSDRQRNNLSQNAYGAIVRITLDNTHPLAFGYDEEYFSLKLSNRRYAFLPRGWNVGITQDSTAIMSGFVGFKAKENFRESMVFGVENMGRGRVIYLADNPLFRAFWYNGKLLFGNAVFIVGN